MVLHRFKVQTMGADSGPATLTFGAFDARKGLQVLLIYGEDNWLDDS